MKAAIEVPAAWAGAEVHFLWDSGCEALVWRDGAPLQGLTGSADGHQARRAVKLGAGASHVLWLEVACNGMFGVGREGMINAPDPARSFTLTQAEIAVHRPALGALQRRLAVLHDIARTLGEGALMGARALSVANAVSRCCLTHCCFSSDCYPTHALNATSRCCIPEA